LSLLFVPKEWIFTTLVSGENDCNLADKVAANAAPNQSAKLAEAPQSSNGAIKSPTPAAMKNRTGRETGRKFFS